MSRFKGFFPYLPTAIHKLGALTQYDAPSEKCHILKAFLTAIHKLGALTQYDAPSEKCHVLHAFFFICQKQFINWVR